MKDSDAHSSALMASALIAPSLLAADMTRLGEELKNIAPYADYIHLDVMDGHFVPNLSFGGDIIKSLRPLTDKIFDVHLMISEPEKWLEHYANCGADIISIHFEACQNPKKGLDMIHTLGKKAGLAINPETDFHAVEDFLDIIDIIVVMGVHPGFGGQTYIETTDEKLRNLKQMVKNKNILLEVDGGIHSDNIKTAFDAGADILVAGTAIFKQDDYKQTIADLRAKLI